MIGPEALAITFGIGSVVAWGVGDFSGGFVTRRWSVFTVIFISQLFGTLVLAILTAAAGPPFPEFRRIVLSCLAGISGALGLITLYKALALGKMGVVAPVASVVSAVLPVLAAFLMEGLPKTTQIIGFGMAAAAVWLISYSRNKSNVVFSELMLPCAAGMFFGLFFILFDGAVGQDRQNLLWPLLWVRLAAFPLLLTLFLVRREKRMPRGAQLLLILSAGLCDVGGNVFFGLAARVGRLDIAAVVCSLYPAVTVLMAWLILKEKLLHQQWLGVLAALAALVLIAA